MRMKFFLPVMMLAIATTAYAQQPAEAGHAVEQLTPQQVQQNQKMAQAALQVAQMIDLSKIGEVWDGASPIAKQAATRSAFIAQISIDRKTLGALASRSAPHVAYSQSDGKKIPAGIYCNVAFAARFTNTAHTVRELVSFHFDSDHVWRVTGYTLR